MRADEGLGATLIAAAAASVDIEVRNTPEQSRVARELGSALHASKNLYENPPVCMRMRPGGEMIAVVLGAGNRGRIVRVLRELHVNARVTVTSIAAFNAGRLLLR